jgi:membrane protease YdiL (CAAX protease family)
MNQVRFAERHPYWFVTALEVVIISIYLLAGTVAHFLNLSTMGLYGLANLILVIVVTVWLTSLRWWKAVGYRAAARGADLLYYLLPFLPAVTNLVPGVQLRGWGYAAEILVIMLMVGFTEESIFRGLMLHAIKPRGPWKAAITTALLFGLTHALNTLAGRSPLDAVVQICFALSLGFAFAALVLKKGLLWPLVLAHWLINVASYMQPANLSYPLAWDLLKTGSVSIIFAAYGLILMLRKEQPRLTQAQVGLA